MVTGRKKEGMEVKSTALAGQRKTTCHAEKESANTDLEFSPWISVVFLTGFVFTGSHLT